jgi:hypothetical protein
MSDATETTVLSRFATWAFCFGLCVFLAAAYPEAGAMLGFLMMLSGPAFLVASLLEYVAKKYERRSARGK